MWNSSTTQRAVVSGEQQQERQKAAQPAVNDVVMIGAPMVIEGRLWEAQS